MNDVPYRLCCGQQHCGPVCPDGRVMCDLCFDRVRQSDLNILPDGSRENICRTCAGIEKRLLETRWATIGKWIE